MRKRRNESSERLRTLVGENPELQGEFWENMYKNKGLLLYSQPTGEIPCLSHLVLLSLPVGGKWRSARKRFGIYPKARGIPSRIAKRVADEWARELTGRCQFVEVRGKAAEGHVIAWCLYQGDTLVLCWTRDSFRKCGIQRWLQRQIWPAGPKSHLLEPRGSRAYFANLGTDFLSDDSQKSMAL